MKRSAFILASLLFLSSCTNKEEAYEEQETKCYMAYNQESNSDSKTFEKTEACLREGCKQWFTGWSFIGIEAEVEKIRGPIDICNG